MKSHLIAVLLVSVVGTAAVAQTTSPTASAGGSTATTTSNSSSTASSGSGGMQMTREGTGMTTARSATVAVQFIGLKPTDAVTSRLIGADVYNNQNEKLGDIEDLVITDGKTISGVVIGVGGFLGIGEKNVAVPFNMLLWNTGDVARTASPSASPTPGNTPANQEAAATRAERMPGANVSNEVLNAVPENRSGTVTPGTGEVTGSAAGGTATVPVVDAEGGPRRAMLRLTKAELQNAPEFRYGREGADTKPPASAPRQ